MKVTEAMFIPASGKLVGKVQPKVPSTLASPPLKTELLSACPKVIDEADGTFVITGVALFTTKLTVLVTGDM